MHVVADHPVGHALRKVRDQLLQLRLGGDLHRPPDAMTHDDEGRRDGVVGDGVGVGVDAPRASVGAANGVAAASIGDRAPTPWIAGTSISAGVGAGVGVEAASIAGAAGADSAEAAAAAGGAAAAADQRLSRPAPPRQP